MTRTHHFGFASLAAVLLSFALPQLAIADENIYAPDVRRAERGLERAQTRLADATADVQQADQMLPSASAEAEQLTRSADGLQQLSDLVDARVDQRETAIENRRETALDTVEHAQARLRSHTTTWRDERALWISLATALLGIAVALGLLAFTATRPRDASHVGRSATRTAIALGTAVTAYLCVLIVALRWSDAWVFSWWGVSAAAIGVAAALGAVAIGWRQEVQLRRSRQFGLALVAGIAALGAVVPGAIAADNEAPRGERLPHRTLELAELADTDAPMPAAVRTARRRADALEARADVATDRADEAVSQQDDLEYRRSDGLARQEKARRAVDIWSERLAQAQADYDYYQELLEPIDGLDDGYDLPPLPESDGLDDLPGSGYPPTTEDFGEGQGTVGFCNDGTLSDSIGRPGACSHHGGVR